MSRTAGASLLLSHIYLPLTLNESQFAYNEISFMLIRLLQNFVSMSLDLDACPPHARVPPEWRDGHGRMAVEQFRPRLHLGVSLNLIPFVIMAQRVEQRCLFK
jgi:hypothetical protein